MDDPTVAPPPEPINAALKIQVEAAVVGFDWRQPDQLWPKLAEEIAELREAIDQGQGEARIRDEFGDLMFMAINLGRHLKLDPAAALRQANAKFLRRFGHVLAQRAHWEHLGVDERTERMEALWQDAKQIGL